MKLPIYVASLVAFGAALVAGAAEITADQASAAVSAWISESPSLAGTARPSVESAETVSTASGSRLHVVKLSGGGFAVTSADDRVDPIIAYVRDVGELVRDDANPLWALLSGDIEARERAAGVSSQAKGGSAFRAMAESATASDAVARAQARWAALLSKSASGGTLPAMRVAASFIPDARVDTFVQTRWNQSTHNNYDTGMNCYNYYTPSNYVCGCVATAGAQIMRYWQWPQLSVEAKTKTCSVDGVSGSFTMQGGTYDWSSMPLVPADGVTDAQCRAIGKLTYDIGVSVYMDWAEDGSSANMFALANRFKDTFGFTNAVAAVYIDGYYAYSLEEVKKAVIPNCNARVPLAMSIRDNANHGHAVLVDGYGYSGDDFYVHVNLGWGGSNDAWYMPPNIEDYTIIRGFVLNVFPEKTGSIISGRVLDSSGAPIANATVTLKRSTTAVDSTTTDANGIYAFIASAGSYLVTASSGEVSDTIGVTLASTTGTRLDDAGAYYSYPSPSIGNTYDSDIALTGVASVAPPVFSPDSCMFYPSTNVTLTCADTDAVIRYTLDGTAPDATSTPYSGPIFVDDTVTIKARAFASGKNPSPVVGATYTYDAAAGAPKGDYFADPINISGASGTRVIDDNSNYTVEDNEPWHTLENYSYWPQHHTVWYKWTAPGSGTMTFATKMTWYNGGTYVAVYTGDTLTALDRIGYGKAWDSDYWTRVTVEVTQGVTYRIVGMSCGEQYTDEFTLTWSGDLTVAQTATSTTPVAVPYAWLDDIYPGQGGSAAAYENLALSDTDGDGFLAWQEYLLDTDPKNADSRLFATVRMVDGLPVFGWSHTNANINAQGYRYAPKGRMSLDDSSGWQPYTTGHRFFKVVVEPAD